VLEGIRVLDLTIALAGPLATLLFASMGAEVIRVEAPGGRGDISRWNPPFIGAHGAHFDEPSEDEISVSMLNRSQGKKSVTLNLKSEIGRQMFLEMAGHADVVIENFSAGTADRLGVGYPAVSTANPAIVYCSINGFGSESPYSLKAMDIIVQAMSGIMEASGDAAGPPVRIGVPIGDMAGSLFATTGVLAALLRRFRTGEGRRVEISLYDCLAALLSIEHFEVYERAGIPTRTGNAHARLTPFGVYPAADGYVAIVAHTDEWSSRLFAAMGQPELAHDRRFLTRGLRVQNMAALTELIEAWTRTLPRDELVRLLTEEHDLPAAPVRTPADAMCDPHLARRGALVPLRHPFYGEGAEPVIGTGLPIRFSGIPPATGARSPMLGEDNESVYREWLGIDAERLDELQRLGIV